jgi:hypothetical protein
MDITEESGHCATICVGDDGKVYASPAYMEALRNSRNNGINGEAARVAALDTIRNLTDQEAAEFQAENPVHWPIQEAGRSWKEISALACTMLPVISVITVASSVFAYFYCK